MRGVLFCLRGATMAIRAGRNDATRSRRACLMNDMDDAGSMMSCRRRASAGIRTARNCPDHLFRPRSFSHCPRRKGRDALCNTLGPRRSMPSAGVVADSRASQHDRHRERRNRGGDRRCRGWYEKPESRIRRGQAAGPCAGGLSKPVPDVDAAVQRPYAVACVNVFTRRYRSRGAGGSSLCCRRRLSVCDAERRGRCRRPRTISISQRWLPRRKSRASSDVQVFVSWTRPKPSAMHCRASSTARCDCAAPKRRAVTGLCCREAAKRSAAALQELGALKLRLGRERSLPALRGRTAGPLVVTPWVRWSSRAHRFSLSYARRARSP